MRGRVLAVVHRARSTPGRVGELLRERGYVVERRCPNEGDPLPSEVAEFSALIVFGGPNSANDDHLPGIRAELEWLEHRALPAGRPLLGICLGAQQIARVLGARVTKHPQGLVEIGYHLVSPTPQGLDFLPRPTWFYQWHYETFTMPAGAVHLATGEVFTSQAFRYADHVYGVEFHPEITREMIRLWSCSDRGRERIARHGAPGCDRQLADHARYAAATDRWLEAFLDDFLP